MRKVFLAVVAAAALGVAWPATAQFQKPEDAIKYRKAGMTMMNAHLGRIGAMANGRVPYDPKVAAENAAVLVTLSKLPYAAFGDGTDKGETRARPEIWSERDKFNAAAARMQDEVVKLDAAARAASPDPLKTAFGAVSQACKACHDSYRKD